MYKKMWIPSKFEVLWKSHVDLSCVNLLIGFCLIWKILPLFRIKREAPLHWLPRVNGPAYAAFAAHYQKETPPGPGCVPHDTQATEQKLQQSLLHTDAQKMFVWPMRCCSFLFLFKANAENAPSRVFSAPGNSESPWTQLDAFGPQRCEEPDVRHQHRKC